MSTDFAEAVIVLGPGGELEDLIPSVASIAEIEDDLGELVAADVVLTAAVALDNLVQVCPASAANAIALNAALGHFVTLSTTESTTITITNLAAGSSLTIVVTAGGAHTVAFAGVFFAGGTEPTQTSSGVDVYTIIKSGTQLYGFVAGQDMKT